MQRHSLKEMSTDPQCSECETKTSEIFKLWLKQPDKTVVEKQLKYKLISLQAYIIFPIKRVHKHPNVQQTEVL